MHTQNKSKKIAVIGSGFGGIAAAIRLQASGYQVEIFEKRDLPGGRAYVYKDKGFTFDAGPTVITAPHCLEDLFTMTGRKMEDYIELIPISPFYRLFWEDGYRFDYSNNSDELFAQIKSKSSGDVEGYKKFLLYSKEVFEEGYTKLAATPFLHMWSMVKVSPQLIKLGAYRSVYSTISKFIKDKHLREAFSFHTLLVGGNPFKTSSIYTLIHFLERQWGVYFPKGGTGALVRALVKYFEELGGVIHYNSEVNEILTSGGKISGLELKNKQRFDFDAVVSNGDVVHTYKELLKHEPIAQKRADELTNKHFSMSLFVMYFGTNKKFENIAHHNILFGNRYKELLNDIFDNGVLPDDFSLYLHAPSISDPDLAPKDHECFYVLAPVAHLGKLNIDWKVEGPKYGEKILSYLETHYMPGLREHVVTQRIFTPKDFETELNSFNGSAFSLEPRLDQSAYFRQHNKDKNLEGLYFVGAGTHPGAGVPGVVNSAKATVSIMLKELA